MKNILILLVLSLSVSTCFSQGSEEVAKTYPIAFEKQVKAKSESGIKQLYVNNEVILNVTRKAQNGSQYFFKTNAGDWAHMVENQIPGAYELNISKEEFIVLDGFAISVARFDEMMNGQHSGDGYDLFTYVKTDNGWKISHMDVTLRQGKSEDNLEENPQEIEQLKGFLLLLERALNNNDLSVLKFMEVKNQITVNEFTNGVLSNSTKYDRTALQELKSAFGIDLSSVEFQDPKIVDDYMAFVSLETDFGHIILTASKQSDTWLITSLTMNLNE